MAEIQFQVKHIEGGLLANGKRFAGKTRTFGSFTIPVLKLAHLVGDIPFTDEKGRRSGLDVTIHMEDLPLEFLRKNCYSCYSLEKITDTLTKNSHVTIMK